MFDDKMKFFVEKMILEAINIQKRKFTQCDICKLYLKALKFLGKLNEYLC